MLPVDREDIMTIRHSFPTRRSSDLLIGNLQTPDDYESMFAKYGMFQSLIGNLQTDYSLPDRILSYSSLDRKSTRLNSSHVKNSYAVFCWKKNSEYVMSTRIDILSF